MGLLWSGVGSWGPAVPTASWSSLFGEGGRRNGKEGGSEPDKIQGLSPALTWQVGNNGAYFRQRIWVGRSYCTLLAFSQHECDLCTSDDDDDYDDDDDDDHRHHHGDWWLVNDNLPYHTEIVIQKNSQKTPLHRANFCTAKFLCRKFLHADAFRHRKFYKEKPLHRAVSTRGNCDTEKTLHRTVFTHRSFYTEKPFTRAVLHTMILHKAVFTHDALTHKKTLQEHLLHREVFCT